MHADWITQNMYRGDAPNFPPDFNFKLPEGPVTRGEGKTCAYMGLGFAVLSLLTVLAFRFPTWFTVAELREVYGPFIAMFRIALQGAMVGGAGLALFSIFRGKQILPAGIALITLAIAQILGGADVPVGPVEANAFAMGIDYFIISLLIVGSGFVAIEKISPLRKDQPILREKWALDMKYFLVNHLLLGFFLIVTNTALNHFFVWLQFDAVAQAIGSIHPVAQFVLLMLAVDVVQYWAHRTFHTVPFLWKIHAVHHSAEHMDWLASSRLHILEPLTMRVLVLGTMFVLGFDEMVVNTYILFIGFQATLLHANINWNLGWFEEIFVISRHHHWHHSADERAINTNFAIHFPVLDRIFGTLYMPEGWPESYGIAEEIPDTVLGQAAYPFSPTVPKPGAK